jgi:hypothetical protein
MRRQDEATMAVYMAVRAAAVRVAAAVRAADAQLSAAAATMARLDR